MGRVTKSVNRPVFRLSQPGQDVEWSMRAKPVDAIRKRKMELAQPTPLPTELPEKVLQDEDREMMYRNEVEPRLKAFGFPDHSPTDPYSPEKLSEVDDDALTEMIESPNDHEVEAVEAEMDRRGWAYDSVLEDQKKKLMLYPKEFKRRGD